MKRAALYLRVSTVDQHPEPQGLELRQFARQRVDLLDYVIALNERHLKRLLNQYVSYRDEDRTHLALDKQTSAGRVPAKNGGVGDRIISTSKLGGLHHRYDLAA